MPPGLAVRAQGALQEWNACLIYTWGRRIDNVRRLQLADHAKQRHEYTQRNTIGHCRLAIRFLACLGTNQQLMSEASAPLLGKKSASDSHTRPARYDRNCNIQNMLRQAGPIPNATYRAMLWSVEVWSVMAPPRTQCTASDPARERDCPARDPCTRLSCVPLCTV